MTLFGIILIVLVLTATVVGISYLTACVIEKHTDHESLTPTEYTVIVSQLSLTNTNV